jgi:phage gp36-like protein
MFLTTEEMKSVAYDYQLDQITETSPDIVEMAINAAVEEMKSYLSPTGQIRWRDGRPRYDVAAIFGKTGSDRNALILELCKSIALYYVCRLANVDIIQERVKERYDRAVDWLEKVAGVGKYANAPGIAPDLPVLAPAADTDDTGKPFRSGSREKFNHE